MSEEEVENFMTTNLKILNEVEESLHRIEFRLDNYNEQKEHLLAKLVINRWFLFALGREWKGFDPLGARKSRTFILGLGEKLMRLLIRLDQVQSNGKEEVKLKRRSLVKRINSELLPRSDSLSVEAQAVVTLFNKIRRICQPVRTEIKKRRSVALKKSLSSQINETDDAENQQAEQYLNSLQKISENESDSDESNRSSLPKKRSSSELKKVPSVSIPDVIEPKFEPHEGRTATIVDINLPRGENASELKFLWDERREELLVQGNNFDQALEINTRKYDVDNIEARVVGPHYIKLVLPKKISQPQRNYQRYGFQRPEHRREYYQPRFYEDPYQSRGREYRRPPPGARFDPFFGW
eukprot:snap_masked-scaffold_48-processed-gene-0.7-mRNA-1 protein AED:1.00 eAED:1.00 QI:0/-1/0/0/-1/1/1/0/352